MNVKQRLRKLEIAAHDRLAAAAAEVTLSLQEDPPLTEKEARRLDLHTLLALVEAELHPAKVRQSAEFARYYARFRRLPLRELFRRYLVLNRRLMKVKAQRRKRRMCKGSDEYYQFLRNIYGDMTLEARRAEREALYPDPVAFCQEPSSLTETSHGTPSAIIAETNLINPRTPPPLRMAWAIA